MLLLAVLVALSLAFNTREVNAAGAFHYSILAETFHPTDSTIGYNNYYAWLTTTSNSTIPGQSSSYVATVNLPDGAVISDIHVFARDLDANNTKDVYACMFRYSQTTNPVFEAVTTCTSSSGAPGLTTINPPVKSVALGTIDNQAYSYAIYLDLPPATVVTVDPPNLGVLRVVIDWSFSTYLPALNH